MTASPREPSPAAARAALVRLCAAGFVAYCSYSICRAPLLPLFARELGAGPSLVGFVMGASTLTGVFLKLPAGALSDLFGRRAFADHRCAGLRDVAIYIPWRVNAGLARGSQVRSWQRDSHLRPGRVGKPVRYCAGRPARHMAEHLLDGARDRSGIRTGPRRVFDRCGSFRSCVHHFRTHRSRRTAHCESVARAAGRNVTASFMARI